MKGKQKKIFGYTEAPLKSFDNWRKMFYGSPDFEAMSPVELIQHALRKWRGLRESVLEAYGMFKSHRYITTSEGFFRVDDETCSLCRVYNCPSNEISKDRPDCPLYLLLGAPCDDNGQPYTIWLDTGNPEPMISALEKIEKAETSDEE